METVSAIVLRSYCVAVGCLGLQRVSVKAVSSALILSSEFSVGSRSSLLEASAIERVMERVHVDEREFV